MVKDKITAIVLAAGKGNRMQSDIPKQFMELCGKPVIYYSLMAFENSPVTDIVLVTGEEYIEYCKNEIVKKYQLDKVKAVVCGGTERYWSVKKGLEAAKGTDYVMIHDAARPCITQEMIERSIEKVKQVKACTVGVQAKDTIKIVDEGGYGIDTPPREKLWQIQTPQSFFYPMICEAYQKMEQSEVKNITDDTMIIERYLGRKTQVIQGDYANMKITTPEDLSMIENFFKKIQKKC